MLSYKDFCTLRDNERKVSTDVVWEIIEDKLIKSETTFTLSTYIDKHDLKTINARLKEFGCVLKPEFRLRFYYDYSIIKYSRWREFLHAFLNRVFALS